MMSEKGPLIPDIEENVSKTIDVVIKQSSRTSSKIIKALGKGPLESVFPGSTSKILDFLATFKDWDYSTSDISRNTGLSFKTTLREIKNLKDQEVILKTRNVGRSNMYKLNLDSKQGHYIDKLIFEIAKKRVREQTERPKQVNSKNELEQAKYSLKKKMKELKA